MSQKSSQGQIFVDVRFCRSGQNFKDEQMFHEKTKECSTKDIKPLLQL